MSCGYDLTSLYLVTAVVTHSDVACASLSDRCRPLTPCVLTAPPIDQALQTCGHTWSLQ